MIYTSTGKSSYKYLACIKLVISTMSDDISVKLQRSLSASKATKQVVSIEWQLNLSEITSNESLSVQTQTARFKGQATVNVVDKFLTVVTNSTARAYPTYR